MQKIEINQEIKNIFTRNRKCIVNADLDGILSGMILQHFLDWKIVGYSSCSGKEDDEIWLEDKKEDLGDCIFVDLPVCINTYSIVDQHFVQFDTSDQFLNTKNKVNPNIMRNRVFLNDTKNCEYTKKYPFGTVHFILAILENMDIIDKSFNIDFHKKILNFDLADLVLRADRVIGNTIQYTPNCLDWSNWIIGLGKHNTFNLFEIVQKQYLMRKVSESNVEDKLKSLGCCGSDGNCSNMFREKSYLLLIEYFSFLSECLGIKPLPIFKLFDFGRLSGKRFEVNNYNLNILKEECKKDNVFSFAFVTMRTLSLTYMEE